MSTSKRLLFPSLAAGALLFTAYSGFGNLITNGGFETFQPADDGVANAAYHTSGNYNNVTIETVGNWVGGREPVGNPALQGPSGANDTTQWFNRFAPALSTGPVANQHPAQPERAAYHPYAAASGSFAVELHSTQSSTSAYDVVYMEQTVFSLIVGQQYTLTFKFTDTDYNSTTASPGNTSNQHASLKVFLIEGLRSSYMPVFANESPILNAYSDVNSSVSTVSTVTTPPVNEATFTSGAYNDPSVTTNLWHDGKVVFTATNSIETVRFLGLASSLGNNMSIDEVNLDATPEPATLGAAALLIGGIGFFERKRLKSLSFFKRFCA